MYYLKESLILASGSPRRKELLESLGLAVQVIISGVDEVWSQSESPKALVERLSVSKATSVSAQYPDSWVLGADTDVEINGSVLGKPRDISDAKRLLGLIQGRRHSVWGSFALVHARNGIQYFESHQSLVDIRALSEDEISAYVETGEPLDKAGAYAVQGVGASLVASIEGSYSNVVGLNLSAVVSALMIHRVISLR